MTRETLPRPSGTRSPCIARGLRGLLLASLTSLLLGTSAVFAESASSDSIDGVVELFTSQGCALCPTADDKITRLAGDRDLLVLSYHVDYWDYIGWRDPLGSSRNSDRQRAYAKAMGERSVYTPQVIVNGARDVSAGDASFDTTLREIPIDHVAPGARIDLTKSGSTLSVSAEAPGVQTPGAQTVLIFLTFSALTSTEVASGENGGKRLINSHSVRDWQVIGRIHDEPLKLEMPLAPILGSDATSTHGAVLLQQMKDDGTPGPILAAATLPL